MVGLDCAIIMNPKVWVASGHVGAFADPTRKCPGCGKFTRADQLWAILAESAWMSWCAKVLRTRKFWPSRTGSRRGLAAATR